VEKSSESDHLDAENGAERTILKFLFQNYRNVKYLKWFKIGSQGLLDSSGSVWSPVVGSGEHDNECSGSVRSNTFL
jgi:hypothetical protein